MSPRLPLWPVLLLALTVIAPTNQRGFTLVGGLLLVALAGGWEAFKRARSQRGAPLR